jgi:putative ABC transport system substrate-binding protein
VRRRNFIGLLGGGILAGAPGIVRAQETRRLFRVGFLSLGVPGDTSTTGAPNVAFLAALAKLGFVEGKTLWIDKAGFGLSPEQMAPHARELAGEKVDIIVAESGDVSIRAAQEATRTIPILGVADDLVGSGFVQSLARPGGNVTGVSILSTELDQKRQDLLLELVPGVRRIAALIDVGTEAPRRIDNLVESARARGVVVDLVRLERREEIVPSIDRARDAGCAAFNVLASPLFYGARNILFEHCAALRLPAIYHLPEMAEDGGLIAYGPSIVRIFREQFPRLFQRLAEGVKPADLPAERPTHLELVINLKTARALGLTVPELLLAEASEVIE